jgi:hypothetical protein
MESWLIILLSLTCLVVWINSLRVSKKPLPLPPGPPAEPLIGHLRLIPPDNQETLFYKWGKLYGKIYLTVPSTQSHILLTRRCYAPSFPWEIHHRFEQRRSCK